MCENCNKNKTRQIIKLECDGYHLEKNDEYFLQILYKNLSYH